MKEKEQECFYVDAALYFNLDPIEVDDVLAEFGLSVKGDSVEECEDAILTRSLARNWVYQLTMPF